MNKTILLTGVIFGVLSIILGAFGAHSLKDSISETSLSSFETGVRYQMYHALLLLILGSWSSAQIPSLKSVYYLITIGTICFSFSIYILSLKDITGWNPRFFGLITPFGGVLLIAGWILLGYRVYKYFN